MPTDSKNRGKTGKIAPTKVFVREMPVPGLLQTWAYGIQYRQINPVKSTIAPSPVISRLGDKSSGEGLAFPRQSIRSALLVRTCWIPLTDIRNPVNL